VSNKSKYTDWTNRQDVKDELYTDVAVLLKKNGYPPKTIDDAYDEIMKQVENYKRFEGTGEGPTLKERPPEFHERRESSKAAEKLPDYGDEHSEV